MSDSAIGQIKRMTPPTEQIQSIPKLDKLLTQSFRDSAVGLHLVCVLSDAATGAWQTRATNRFYWSSTTVLDVSDHFKKVDFNILDFVVLFVCLLVNQWKTFGWMLHYRDSLLFALFILNIHFASHWLSKISSRCLFWFRVRFHHGSIIVIAINHISNR